jgi:hypothetical protein
LLFWKDILSSIICGRLNIIYLEKPRSRGMIISRIAPLREGVLPMSAAVV